uniref:Uncharacterized protein n=1 Tax=Steinernema glaseri TaxID=37863 RepID=A0A1I7Y0G4_9BILA
MFNIACSQLLVKISFVSPHILRHEDFMRDLPKHLYINTMANGCVVKNDPEAVRPEPTPVWGKTNLA